MQGMSASQLGKKLTSRPGSRFGQLTAIRPVVGLCEAHIRLVKWSDASAQSWFGQLAPVMPVVHLPEDPDCPLVTLEF